MRIELLPTSRWNELERALRESRSDEQLPKPENSIILSAFDGEQMIGCIGAERVWNVSPLWVERSHRGNDLAKTLAETLAAYNTERLAEYCSTSSPHVEKLIFEMGFVPTLGQMWRRDIG